MSFDFSGVKTNLEGINKYLESNGTKLTDNESKQLVSIFKEVDKNGNNVIDLDEQQLFKNLVEQKLNTLKDKINTFFSGIGNAIIGNKPLVAEPDATRVDNTNNTMSPIHKMTQSPELPAPKAEPVTKQITAQSSVISDNTVYDEDIMNQALNNLIKRQNSKLKNKATAFIQSAKRDSLTNKLDPFILIAISMEESAHGASKASIEKNNVGGIMGKKGLRKFDSIESCVDSIAKTIDTRTKEGRKTISSIGHSGRYCDKSVASQWIINVTRYAENLRQEYNRLLEQNNK